MENWEPSLLISSDCGAAFALGSAYRSVSIFVRKSTESSGKL